LVLQGVGKSFAAQQVLQGIDLRCEAGQVTAIVGDNGAGKSTLLKLMAGIHAADQGRVTLDEVELTRLSAAEHRRRGIEMVYQDLALAAQQDVVTNLYLGREVTSFGWLNRSVMTRQARLKLDQLGIRIADLRQPVGVLSGGQKQAVAIARAVLFDPQVLLLDEPTAALAAREVQQVLDMIRRERAHGRIVILVSHRLNDVFTVADRIVVMKQGRIAYDTPVAATTLAKTVERIVE
jgi:ABC-type sugar transport system ATPase subunit